MELLEKWASRHWDAVTARLHEGRGSESCFSPKRPSGWQGDDVTMVTMIFDFRLPFTCYLFFFSFSEKKRESIFTSSPTFVWPLVSRLFQQ
jgi:hypothetical protein